MRPVTSCERTLPDQDARYVSVHVQPGISRIILLKAKLQIN